MRSYHWILRIAKTGTNPVSSIQSAVTSIITAAWKTKARKATSEFDISGVVRRVGQEDKSFTERQPIFVVEAVPRSPQEHCAITVTNLNMQNGFVLESTSSSQLISGVPHEQINQGSGPDSEATDTLGVVQHGTTKMNTNLQCHTKDSDILSTLCWLCETESPSDEGEISVAPKDDEDKDSSLGFALGLLTAQARLSYEGADGMVTTIQLEETLVLAKYLAAALLHEKAIAKRQLNGLGTTNNVTFTICTISYDAAEIRNWVDNKLCFPKTLQGGELGKRGANSITHRSTSISFVRPRETIRFLACASTSSPPCEYIASFSCGTTLNASFCTCPQDV